MKRIINFPSFQVLLLGFLLAISNSCTAKVNPKPLPVLTTTEVTKITQNITATDIDGNVYHTITIGTQVWMVENLKTTHYNDGTAIQNITDDYAWTRISDMNPAYCWYNNDSTTYKNKYGALYNWNAVNTGKLAPTGWHVPSDAEWTTLTTYLGGESIAGRKLKEAGTLNWLSPNTGATNETGFSALPGGYRFYSHGAFYELGNKGYWWSSTKSNTYDANFRNLKCDGSNVLNMNLDMRYGFSVRCVRD